MNLHPNHRLAALLLLGAAILPAANAAESYDGCTGFIDAVPAVITAPGTWCLRKDLGTAMAHGTAIRVDADDVTIDCNDFKLGGLAAGPTSTASGISSAGNANTTVRQCNVRGFYYGIDVNGGGSHLVEDNRLDNVLRVGISATNVFGHVQVRRNRLFATGGAPENAGSYGIYCEADEGACDIQDNAVNGVVGAATWYNPVFGIRVTASQDGRIAGNRVRGLAPTGAGQKAYGIYAYLQGADHVAIAGNRLALDATSTGSVAVQCGVANSTARGNLSIGFEAGVQNCIDDGGNAAH